MSTVFLYLRWESRHRPVLRFALGDLMFYRNSKDGLICLGVAFALMCNRQMLDIGEDKPASFVSQGASEFISQVIH